MLSRPAQFKWSVCALAFALATLACAGLGQAVTPTPEAQPSPTVFVPGVEPTATSAEAPGTPAAPTGTAVPLETAIAATATPPGAQPTGAAPTGAAPTPTGEAVPEAVLILEPGAGSEVTSPVRVAGEADPTFEQNQVVQITDADGNILATMPTTIGAEAGERGPFQLDVPFTAPPGGMPGRISVFHTSARDGGLMHLTSVEVLLMGAGSAPALRPPDALAASGAERLRIDEPRPLAEVSGGRLYLAGWSEYVFENTLVVVLCGEGGSGAPEPVCGTADNILASGIALVQSPDMGQPGPFVADLAYSVSAPVSARLAVYHTSARDGGLLHLTTVSFRLLP